MKISKLMALILCMGMLGPMSLMAQEDKDKDDDGAKQVKTMEQAWKSALEQFGDDQESAKKAMEFYKANFAEKIKCLEKELKDDSDEVVSELSEDLGECNGMLALKDESPEEFKKQLEYMKLEVKVDLMGEKIQDLKDEDAVKNKAEIEKIEKELKGEIGRLFDMKLQREKEELKNLEKDIEKLKQHIKQREENREKIIEKKFKDLTGVEENLEF
ncbi:MAG TPA: hypothetical protein DCZ94_12130 [Lentisphaeria bacterium]|nr:MAG: hypothetical protein A2X48_12735 [Lentisphaerae bacterium GWF2_49_21]HBC87697.1 hypothetical protein [Lentisphaeria bacterium]